jgi:hypothetical protein
VLIKGLSCYSRGVHRSRRAGAEHFARYSHLVSSHDLPFVRASGSERVVLSATNWTEGMACAFRSHHDPTNCKGGKGFALASHGQFKPQLSVIIQEGPGFNNTLDGGQCPPALPPDPQVDAWRQVYAPPITSRLREYAPSVNLSNEDISSLVSLCPFESVSMYGWQGKQGEDDESKWCGVFTTEEWRNWEYENDLGKFYGTG